MPRVASEPSVLRPPHPDPGARHRPARSESGEPASPFALLVDTADPPPVKERGSRASRASSAEATEQRAKPSDEPNDRRADSPPGPAPTAADARAADDTETSAETPQVEHAEDETSTDSFDVLAVAGNVTQPAPPATIAPVSVEALLLAQGGGEATAEDDIAATGPAALPELPAPGGAFGNQTAQSNLTTTGSETATDSEMAAVDRPAPAQAPVASVGEAPAPIDSPVADDTEKHTAPADSPQQPDSAPATDARAQAPKSPSPTERQMADTRAATAAEGEAALVETAKRPPPPDSPPAETRKTSVNATTTEGNKPVDSAEPEETARPVREPQRPHEHADASKLEDTERQPLGAQVSDAAHSANPPSEAVHAVLQARDQAAGTIAHSAPAAGQANLEPAVPIAGLAIEIAARAHAGHNRFEIRLDPPELGRIDVRLDIDSSGQVTSRLVVERAETLEHLRRDAADLERALQQAGLKTAQNGLQFSLRDQGFAGRDDGGYASNRARLVVPDSDLAPIDTLPGGYGRMLRTSGIDIRV